MKKTNAKRVLLISNSTLYGSGYLDHAEGEVRSFLGTVGRVLFVPFALTIVMPMPQWRETVFSEWATIWSRSTPLQIHNEP